MIWKAISSGTETTSGKIPTRIPRKILHRWIYILSLNVGDKGATKIKWWHALDAEASGMWRKIWFYVTYKTHNRSDKHGSISFMIDNMHYVIFRIWEQDSVPWCDKIQNKRLEVLGNTFNLHSNSTLRPRSVVSQSVSKGELSSGFTCTYTPLHNDDSLK